MKKKIEIDKVISNNNCVGCGSCVIDDNKNYMKINNIGQYVPRFSKTTNLNKIDKYCPFSSNSLDENQLSKSIFKNKKLKFNQNIGNYKSIFVGYEKSKMNFRKTSSSGGMTTWLIQKLMLNGDIDAFISVGWAPQKKKI